MSFSYRIGFRVAALLYRRAFPVYRVLYGLYKAISERHDRTMASSYLREGCVVVDVGANIGEFARFAARRVGPDGRVIAFEPSPENYLHLKATTARMRQIEPVHAALSDHVGTITLYLSDAMNVDHRTYDAGEDRAEEKVTCFSLDGWLDEGPVDFIKIDVQGFEYEVVSGMRRILAKNPDVTVAFEFWPAGLRRAGREPSCLLDLFADLGFGVRFSDGRSWVDTRPNLGDGLLDYVTAVARR